jgi:hypothetical protein
MGGRCPPKGRVSARKVEGASCSRECAGEREAPLTFTILRRIRAGFTFVGMRFAFSIYLLYWSGIPEQLHECH